VINPWYICGHIIPSFMRQRRNIKNIFSRAILFLGYFFFLLVQLNIHVGAVPCTHSYFSGDYAFSASGHARSTAGQPAVGHQPGNGKKVSCRLNKRFYPQYFSAVLQTPCVAPAVYFSKALRLPGHSDALKDLRLLVYGLRGPPAMV
jgi:hypothetical protein